MKSRGSCWAGPTLHWLLDGWPCPLLDSIARELAQPSCESCLLFSHHEMAPPLITGEGGVILRVPLLAWGEAPQWPGLSSSTTTQAHSLELVKGISMTWYPQGDCRMSERSFSEGPVMMVYQKPDALNQTNNLQWTSASEVDWTKGIYCVTHPNSQCPRTNEDVLERQKRWRSKEIFVVVVLLVLIWFWGWGVVCF